MRRAKIGAVRGEGGANLVGPLGEPLGGPRRRSLFRRLLTRLERVERSTDRDDGIALRRGNVRKDRRADVLGPGAELRPHGAAECRRRDGRAQRERLRTTDDLALRAHNAPVEGPVPLDVLDVQGLAGADDRDRPLRRVRECLQHAPADVADLDTFDPIGMPRGEAGVEPLERREPLLVHVPLENCHQVDVAAPVHVAAGRERAEEVQAEQIGSELHLEQARELGYARVRVIHGPFISWTKPSDLTQETDQAL